MSKQKDLPLGGGVSRVKRAIMGSYRPHDRVGIEFGTDSRTRQEFAAECDINTIMSRYNKTGVVSHVNPSAPRYLDLAGLPDFQSAMQMMIDADQAFAGLPAVVRKEFDNDPAKFVDFATEPDNLGKLREWGLAPPEKAPEGPMRVEVVNPAPPADKAPGGA